MGFGCSALIGSMETEDPSIIAKVTCWVVYQVHRARDGQWYAGKPLAAGTTMEAATSEAYRHATDNWHVGKGVAWMKGGGAKGLCSFTWTLPHQFDKPSYPWESQYPGRVPVEIAYVVEGF